MEQWWQDVGSDGDRKVSNAAVSRRVDTPGAADVSICDIGERAAVWPDVRREFETSAATSRPDDRCANRYHPASLLTGLPVPMKVFGIAGWSNAGKTTLIERLLPVLIARGLRVSLVKHAHEKFDVDRPGKDSYRFREAGAREVLISSPARWALMHEHRGDAEPGLVDLLAHLSACDLALVEGFKRDAIAKLEVHRVANGKPLIAPDDHWIGAIASDVPVDTVLPQFRLDDIDAIAAHIVDSLGRMAPWRPSSDD